MLHHAIVETDALVKRFRSRVALDRVDLRLAPGRLMALIGANGSGKSTLLKLLAGFLRPTAGTARVFGLDPFRSRPLVMGRARFAFAPPPLYDTLTARETLFALSAIGDPDAARPAAADVDAVLERVGLADRADDRVRVFSFGMRQRLALAQALLPLPRLLVLDEPTDGLDPLAVVDVRRILRGLCDEHGVTILLASHLLVEVEKLADALLVLREGKVIFDGPPAALLNGARRLSLVVEGNGEASDRAAAALRSGGLEPTVVDRHSLTLPIGAIRLPDASRRCAEAGVTLRSFHETTPSLHNALLARLGACDHPVEESPDADRI